MRTIFRLIKRVIFFLLGIGLLTMGVGACLVFPTSGDDVLRIVGGVLFLVMGGLLILVAVRERGETIDDIQIIP